MNGYVKNKSNGWRHAMKRSVGPGHKIPLDELFEQYGEKHDIQEGKPFVDWLRQIKLPDRTVWEIVYQDEKKEEVNKKEKIIKTESEEPERERLQPDKITKPIVKKEMEISDITGMSVRTARVELKKITDIKLLKYAFREANQMANKDTLCRLLRRRINELEITRR